MKRFILLFVFLISATYAQTDSLRPANSIYRNFKPFATPRTNYRPGTVYRIDSKKVEYQVQDVTSIKSLESEEGDITGRMVFTRDEMLELLSIEFNQDYISCEVEMRDVIREYTEQTNVDNVLWENDAIDELVVDPESKYYIIRETVSTKEILYKFDKKTADNIVVGKGNLKEKIAGEGQVFDNPFSTLKKFRDAKRIFFLEQEIKTEPYSKN